MRLSPVSGDIGASMRELFDGDKYPIMLVHDGVRDEDMKCGGRASLHEHLTRSARRNEPQPLKCGGCVVARACLIGQAKA